MKKTILRVELKHQFSGELMRLYGCEQAFCTKDARDKSNKRKILTQSKKKSPAAMRKQIELQIMDQEDVSIEKVAKQFLVWVRNLK